MQEQPNKLQEGLGSLPSVDNCTSNEEEDKSSSTGLLPRNEEEGRNTFPPPRRSSLVPSLPSFGPDLFPNLLEAEVAKFVIPRSQAQNGWHHFLTNCMIFRCLCLSTFPTFALTRSLTTSALLLLPLRFIYCSVLRATHNTTAYTLPPPPPRHLAPTRATLAD